MHDIVGALDGIKLAPVVIPPPGGIAATTTTTTTMTTTTTQNVVAAPPAPMPIPYDQSGMYQGQPGMVPPPGNNSC